MVTRLQIICILRTVLQNVFRVRTHFAASDTINAYFIIYGLFAYYLHEYLRTVLSTHAPCTDTYHVSTSIPRKYVGTHTQVHPLPISHQILSTSVSFRYI